jgi:nucleoside-diphosphate-sugar epimerase
MKILFIGGNGQMSWHCATKAIEAGHRVWVLNRGETVAQRRPKPKGAIQIFANMRDLKGVRESLANLKFDVVSDFICYNPEQALADIDMFRNKVRQFIFISSAANYKRPCAYPILESHPFHNFLDWEYSMGKIRCEKLFLKYFKKEKFPVTIIRPGHTYDTTIPDAIGRGDWTTAKRLLEGKPILIPGDGSALWTATHAEDLARAFLHLLDNKKTLGEAYHITSDENLTWKEITDIVASTLGVKKPRYLYVPTDIIVKLNPSMKYDLFGHKTWCDIYNNSKIKSVAKNWKAEITFVKGVKRTIKWLTEDTNRRRLNPELDSFYDKISKDFENFYSKICP